jgi:hypothetical protein
VLTCHSLAIVSLDALLFVWKHSVIGGLGLSFKHGISNGDKLSHLIFGEFLQVNLLEVADIFRCDWGCAVT